ncbi:MAG: single-stranded DNA-binding protein [Planctomycetota bacterium]
MANFNKVMLMGNLTRDVEMRYTPSGIALARLGLAVNRKYRDSKTNELREEVTFVDIDVWGKQAETANQYLSKGQAIFIEGRLKFDQWDDKQTGQKRSKLLVVAERFQFIGARPDGSGAKRPPSSASPQQTPSSPPPQTSSEALDVGPEDLNIPEETIPF